MLQLALQHQLITSSSTEHRCHWYKHCSTGPQCRRPVQWWFEACGTGAQWSSLTRRWCRSVRIAPPSLSATGFSGEHSLDIDPSLVLVRCLAHGSLLLRRKSMSRRWQLFGQIKKIDNPSANFMIISVHFHARKRDIAQLVLQLPVLPLIHLLHLCTFLGQGHCNAAIVFL